jgi:hypothetical protein
MSSFQRSQFIAHNLEMRPLAGRIGGAVGGVKLAGDLPEGTIAAIEVALANTRCLLP